MKSLMVQGTTSGAGKTTLVAALCRIFSDKNYSVAPFKSQNMSNFSYTAPDFEISRAQAIQAIAARCQIEPDLNPIMLKPLGNYYSLVYLNGKRYKKMHAKEYYAKFVKSKGIKAATDSLSRLKKNYDLIILEGAGSPAEINLQKYDIANMQIAQKANASVLLVSDIDKGGSFASIVGTMALIEKKYQKLVKGFVFNKFRGDIDILKPGFRKLKQITKIPVLGTIPMIKMNLPEEDSLDAKPKEIVWTKNNIAKIDKELDKLAKTVKNNLDIKTIESMIK
ncbi:cobyric acid synthase [Marine Group I thaumarchaeote]|jgi:adenosylcobyric acid synthase|uniref:Probable cobyric acid synthase n=1 Tax=Marine Group I thaumarchaeote TaxID=2511932 RepID=A0A7K4MFH3_9ARCH|nr:cobalamin biosynthesis protein CobQ [Nitrosopumilus sp. PRT-SC01]NWJ27967.1 cobyric acid synthase [Marine Group I thaumarchaeote]NWJ29420.1 cobyric acid synthase [Marine Group I thaumarchaeote]NWK01667.1 cobyric acid synthase [Marine Group I thaumarchaeote]NWK07007.1 cobyric acid synthase [Marine Group I thaumarchaeote]